MLIRSLWHRGPFAFLLLTLGCSTPQSQERLDTVLCWLRPSCIPQQPSTTRNTTPPEESEPSPAPQTSKSPSIPPTTTPSKQVALQSPPEIQCATFAETTLGPSKPFVEVNYIEPTTLANGDPLTDLIKTTIYIYSEGKLLGSKDFLASRSQGGGRVPKQPQTWGKIPLPNKPQKPIQAKVCAKATREKDGIKIESN